MESILMAGTKAGGLKAAATNKAKYGDDFYKNIGGNHVDTWIENGRKPRGFSTMTKEQIAEAGRKGGAVSKRGPGKKTLEAQAKAETETTFKQKKKAWQLLFNKKVA